MSISYESAKTLIDAIFESMRTCLDNKDYIGYSTLSDIASKISCLSENKPAIIPNIDTVMYTQADLREIDNVDYEEDEKVTFYGEYDLLGE